MMIPKIIHYCWFGGNPLPKLAEKCIKSWKKFCPDYQIVRWDESNYDISSAPLYVRQAYEAKKWAFVTDYVRLQVVYENGGIYLDTDVELIKPLDRFLNHSAYFGFESNEYVATGLGFGAEKGNAMLTEMMEDYQNIPFVLEDGTLDTLACPYRNTAVFIKHGIQLNNRLQVLTGDVLILPTKYLCPIEFATGKQFITQETVSIHWYNASWRTEAQKKRDKRRQFRRRMDKVADRLIHLPNRLLIAILGQKNYQKLKVFLKGE